MSEIEDVSLRNALIKLSQRPPGAADNSQKQQGGKNAHEGGKAPPNPETPLQGADGGIEKPRDNQGDHKGQHPFEDVGQEQPYGGSTQKQEQSRLQFLLSGLCHIHAPGGPLFPLLPGSVQNCRVE